MDVLSDSGPTFRRKALGLFQNPDGTRRSADEITAAAGVGVVLLGSVILVTRIDSSSPTAPGAVFMAVGALGLLIVLATMALHHRTSLSITKTQVRYVGPLRSTTVERSSIDRVDISTQRTSGRHLIATRVAVLFDEDGQRLLTINERIFGTRVFDDAVKLLAPNRI